MATLRPATLRRPRIEHENFVNKTKTVIIIKLKGDSFYLWIDYDGAYPCQSLLMKYE